MAYLIQIQGNIYEIKYTTDLNEITLNICNKRKKRHTLNKILN